MEKNEYSKGQPVICYDSPLAEEDPVIGYVSDVFVNPKGEAVNYQIEWCDNEHHIYSKTKVDTFVKLYYKYLNESSG